MLRRYDSQYYFYNLYMKGNRDSIKVSSNKFNHFVSGGISGAILDEESNKAEQHASMYYEEIRHMRTDVQKIAENTGYSMEQIQIIKNYLFIDEHELNDELKRFDPCFAIAESWRRLAFDFKNVQQHDLTLLHHEIMEMNLIIQGMDQRTAHDLTSEKYNCPEESRSYYRKLRIEKNKNHINHVKNNIDFER